MSVNVGDIIATTLKNRQDEIVDNVSNHNSLLRRLRARGNWVSEDGGATLECPIDYIENGTGKFYAGGQDSWSVPTESVIDSASYDWKFYGIFTYATEAERVKNSGKHAVHKLVKAKVKNMERTMANDIATSLYSDGTGSGGLELGGLQLLIDDDPTSAGTVGGIDQNAASGAFWRNYYSAATATTSSSIQGRMKAAWLNIIRGQDKPQLILADDVMFTYYWDSLTANQRYIKRTDGNVMDSESLAFESAEVLYDDNAPAKHMYFVNLDHLMFAHSPGRLFKVEGARKVTNANYDVIPAFFAGNLLCSRRASQGVVIAS